MTLLLPAEPWGPRQRLCTASRAPDLCVHTPVCAHSSLRHTHHCSKVFLLCPKGLTVARPWAEVPHGISSDSRTDLPQGGALGLPLFQEGSLHPRGPGWGPLGRLWGKPGLVGEMAELQEISRWMKRLHQRESPRTQIPWAASCPSTQRSTSCWPHLCQHCG